MSINNRTTAVVGAGAVMDFDLPTGARSPGTKSITDAIRSLKVKNLLTREDIVEIEEIYQILLKEYPCQPNFETIFHVLEMMMAYGWVWHHPTRLPKTPHMFPVFASFASPKWLFDEGNVRQALDEVLLTIMDIVNEYNAPYLADTDFNTWYRCFWKCYGGSWDVFNYNYDTTIEHTLDHCEDGFDDIPGRPDFQHFVPQKLWNNKSGVSTMSHPHGCIEFFDSRYDTAIYEKEYLKYAFHDLYKYRSYDIVRKMFIGSGKSKLSNQAGEQFVNTPIITGLLKPDKLNILPFAFYHSHMYNCVMRNNSLLVVGYSFGDLYINQLLERMELVHGARKRVVLIDYWRLPGEEELEILHNDEQRGRALSHLMEHMTWESGDDLAIFLCRMTGKSSFPEAVHSFTCYDRTGPMISDNGCLMLFIGGFKAASVHKEKIYSFLDS